MSAIGPAFLHRPIPGLAVLSSAHVWDWFVSGLAIAAPSRLRDAGWRAVYQFVPADADARGAVPQRIERSWLGTLRFAPEAVNAPAVPLAIELPARDVYETRVNLPIAARDALREAISHRLDVMSPLPASEVAFAVGPVEPSPPDRLDVAVALVRKAAITRLLDSSDGGRIGMIGAAPQASAAFDYVFYRRPRTGAARQRALLKSISIIVGVGLLILGSDIQLDRRLAAASAHEAALLNTLRAEKVTAGFLADMPQAATENMKAISIMVELNRMSSALPDGVWLEEVSMTKVGISANGYARRNAAWPQGGAPTLSPSDRPDIDRFALRLAAEAP